MKTMTTELRNAIFEHCAGDYLSEDLDMPRLVEEYDKLEGFPPNWDELSQEQQETVCETLAWGALESSSGADILQGIKLSAKAMEKWLVGEGLVASEEQMEQTQTSTKYFTIIGRVSGDYEKIFNVQATSKDEAVDIGAEKLGQLFIDNAGEGDGDTFIYIDHVIESNTGMAPIIHGEVTYQMEDLKCYQELLKKYPQEQIED